MTTVSKPLPCPFCGTKVRIRGESIIHRKANCFLYNLGIEPGKKDKLSMKMFVDSWNTRS
jgi:hypothetical protein